MAKRDNAVIYTRVSVTRSKDESMSVTNQRNILTGYAHMVGLDVQRIFTDDGWSGSDFQRPAFTEMMEFVKLNKPDAILVVDLSRFGRDCIEMGRYTDYILPGLGCKLVAVNDSGDDVMRTLRTIFNDFYLMDVSKKIKAAHRTMALEGKRVAGRPPYGFRPDPDDKHKFVVDAYSAGIVRRIFEMRVVGFSYAKITAALNNEGILSPREYEYHWQGKEYPYKTRSVWLVKAVKDIMKNEAYLGHRVQLQHGVISYKNHKHVLTAPDKWIRAENAHPAIIGQDLWDAAKAINDGAKAGYKGKAPTPALFQGFLRCADCGGLFSIVRQTVTFVGVREWALSYYKCSRYAGSGGSACTSHMIREDALGQILLADIQKHAAAIDADHDAMAALLQSKMNRKPARPASAAEPGRLQKRLEELDRKISSLYEDKVSGAITGEGFQTALRECQAEREAVQEEQARIVHECDEAKEQTGNVLDWMAMVAKHGGIQDIRRDLLEDLVERIEIGEPEAVNGVTKQDIRVVYKYIGDVFHMFP